MLIEDYTQASFLCLANDVVEFPKPLRLKPVLRVHMLECLQINADEIEPALVNFGEVPPLESPRSSSGPIWIIAKHVDPAAERLVVGLQCNRLRSGCARRGRR